MSRPHDSQRNDRTFCSSSNRANGIIDVVLLLGLSGSWLGLFGHWHWSLDLFSHFRWQYLLVSVLAIGWTLWRKRRGVLVIALTTLALNAALIGRLAWNSEIESAPLSPDFKLRVLSLNVLSSNQNHEQVLSYARSADADVLFFMEINPVWAKALQPLTQSHPHHLLHPRPDNFGLALFSRLALEDLRVLSLREAGVPSVAARLKHQGLELMVLGVHPVPPIGSTYARLRDDQLRAISQHVNQPQVPVLAVGDFNATPWSAGMRILLADGKLGFRSLQAPWVPTWRVGSPLAIPIDHALCTAPLVVVQRAVGPDTGSDHRPLLLELGWAK